MSRDSLTLPSLSKYIDASDELVINGKWLTQIHKSRKKKLYLAVTEFSIYFFSQSSSEDGLHLKSHYSLFDIQKMEFTENCFRIVFIVKSFTFEETPVHSEALLQLITSQLCAIMVPREFPQIPETIKLAAVRAKPYTSIQSRFRAKMKKQDRKIPDYIISYMKQIFSSQPTVVVITDFPDVGEYMQELLESLEIEPHISSLQFDFEEGSRHWHTLSSFIGKNSTIKRLIVHEPLGRGFFEFCNECSKNESLILQRLDFFDSYFTPSALDVLEKVVSKRPLKVISFTHCGFQDNDVLLNFIEHSHRYNLASLHFTSIDMTKRMPIYQSMMNLQIISLRGCKCEIADLFPILANSAVTTADFTKNQADQLITLDAPFPPSLTRITLNDICWRPENLIAIFGLLSMATHPICLSFSRADMDDIGWNHFFSIIENMDNANLGGLSWKDNPINSKFVNYLLYAKNLQYLSLAGVKPPSDGCFYKLLETNCAIKTLDLHGTNFYQLRSKLPQILKSLKRSKVERLDISWNCSGKLVMPKVVDFINTSKSIKEILLDGNGFDNEDSLVPLSQAILNHGTALFVPFPSTDAGDGFDDIRVFMQSSPKCDVTEFGDLEWMHLQKSQPETEILIPGDNDEDALKPDISKKNASSSSDDEEMLMSVKKEDPTSWAMETVDIPEFNFSDLVDALTESYNLRNITARLLSCPDMYECL